MNRKQIINLLNEVYLDKVKDGWIFGEQYQEEWFQYCNDRNIYQYHILEYYIHQDLLKQGLETKYKYLLPSFITKNALSETIEVNDAFNDFNDVDIKEIMADFILEHEDPEKILNYTKEIINEYKKTHN